MPSLAAEIVEDLQAALDQFAQIAADLAKPSSPPPSRNSVTARKNIAIALCTFDLTLPPQSTAIGFGPSLCYRQAGSPQVILSGGPFLFQEPHTR